MIEILQGRFNLFKLDEEGLAWSNGRANISLSEMKKEVRLMNFRKKLWLGCSVLALAGHALAVPAQVIAVTWQARDLNEVLSEVEVTEENGLKYTVKYGDTLSVISEAMAIDLRYLAAINEIDNVDLIFPETTLIAQFDDNLQVDGLSVEAPSGESVEVYIPVNLSPLETVEEIEVVVVEEAQAESEDFVEEEIPEELIEEEFSDEASDEVIEETTPEPELEGTLPSTPEVGEGSLETDVPTEEPEAGAVTPEEEVEIPEVPEYVEPEEEVAVPEEEIETPEVTAPEEEVDVPEEEIETPEVTEPEEEVAVPEEPEYVEPEEPEYVEPEEPEYVEPEEPEYVEPEVIESDPAGLSANAAAFRDLVVSMYGVTAYGLRPGDSGDHGTGLAVDFMVPVGSELGDAIANFAISNMGSNGISYVIWEQQIYGDWSYSWVPMEDRGSITANHYDHVHVSFNY